MNEQLRDIQQILRQKGLPFEHTRQPEGESILYSVEKADCILELWAGGKLSCQFGVDMEELRMLVAGSSNEDIAEDELQRVARDHLRPHFQKYRGPLLVQHFDESVETTEHSYAVSFHKSVDLSDPAEVVKAVQECLSALS